MADMLSFMIRTTSSCRKFATFMLERMKSTSETICKYEKTMNVCGGLREKYTINSKECISFIQNDPI